MSPSVPEDEIDLPQLHPALAGTRFAGRVQHFRSIGSTNSALMEAASTLPTGTVFVADEQTAGRGRGGHTWHSAPGSGLYVSALVRPALTLRDALPMSLATGLAAWQAVHALTTLAIDLRWPNDLMLQISPEQDADGLRAPEKKLGGILVETASAAGENAPLRHAVIGIGINVHQQSFPPELATATSLTIAADSELNVVPTRTQLLSSLLIELDRELHRLERTTSRAALFARFTEHSSWARGRRVHVAEAGGYTGTTAGLDAHGFLLVEGDDGQQHTVLSGGVRDAHDAAQAT